MRRLSLWRRGTAALAAVGACMTFACGDAEESLTPRLEIAPPSFALLEHGNGPGQCMFDDAVDFGYAQDKLNCTSEDIDIAETFVQRYKVYGVGETVPSEITAGDLLPYTGGRIECVPGETVAIEVDILLENNAKARYDIGFWLNPDPNAADPLDPGYAAIYGDLCNHYNLLTTDVCCLDDTPDGCGDMEQNVTATIELGFLTLECVDPQGDGIVDLDACTAWENNTSGANEVICPIGFLDKGLEGPYEPEDFRLATTPGTSAKCKCGQLGLPIDIKSVLRVEKVTVGGDDEFTFTSNYGDAFALSNGDVDVSDPLSAGTYTVTEQVTEGWELIDIACVQTDGGAPATYTVTGNGVDVTLGQGDDVTCTFTNEADAFIVVEKVCQTVDAEPTQSFAFTTDFAGGPESLACGENKKSDPLDPGTFAVSETVPEGWDLTSATCDDGSPIGAIDVAAGETVTCTFENTQRGRITVVKNSEGMDRDFAFTSGTLGAFSITTVANTGQSDFPNLVPGSYDVAETVPDGWVLNSATCDDDDGMDPANIQLDPGEHVTCTFVNTQSGKIIVDKVTDPVGSEAVFDFTGPCGSFTLFDTQTPNECIQAPGTYAVSEIVPAGWELTSATCDDGSSVDAIDLAAGETVTCTFNNEQDAYITVEKVCVTAQPDPGQMFAFTSDFDGGPGSLDCGGSATSDPLDPGSYAVSETEPEGWDLTSAVCDNGDAPDAIALNAGDDVTCTFTNTQRGRIIVDKVVESVVPGDQDVPFTFDPSWSETDFTLAASDGTEVSPWLVPGSHSVAETVPSGWDLKTATCDNGDTPDDISVGAGEEVTCTFTNTKRGQIRVAKETVPDGHIATFDFTGDVTATLSDGETSPWVEVAPNAQYTVTEAVPSEWDVTDITCTEDGTENSSGSGNVATFNVEPGESVTCTFTNSRKPRLEVTKTIIGGGTQLFDFTVIGLGSLTFSETFSLGDGGEWEPGYVTPGDYQVCELDLAVAWSASVSMVAIAGSPSASAMYNPDSGEDLGNRCIDVTLNYADVATVDWENTPPPQGDARTIGYWKNWSSCSNGRQYEKAVADGMEAHTLDGNLPQAIGDLVVSTCPIGVSILDKRNLDGRKSASDAAYGLAAQLLAAKLNLNAGAYTCASVQEAVADAQQLLVDIGFDGTGTYLKRRSTQRTDALMLAEILDMYNNNMLPGCGG